jgi:hypothetical protein
MHNQTVPLPESFLDTLTVRRQAESVGSIAAGTPAVGVNFQKGTTFLAIPTAQDKKSEC